MTDKPDPLDSTAAPVPLDQQGSTAAPGTQARPVTLVIPVSRDLLERVPPDQRDFRVDQPDLLDRLAQQGLTASLVSRVRRVIEAIQDRPDARVVQVVLAPPEVMEALETRDPPVSMATRVPRVTLEQLVAPALQEIKEYRDPPVPQVLRELREKLDRQVYRDPPGSPAPPGIRDRVDRQARRGIRGSQVPRGRKG